MPNRPGAPLAVRLLARLQRRSLPPSVLAEFGDEPVEALHDRYRDLPPGPFRGPRLWRQELTGMFRASMHDRATARRTPTHSYRRFDMFDAIRWNVRYAFRMIAKTPTLSAIAILSLSLGIAANGMIYSVMHSWLVRPLPYANAAQLSLLYEIEPAVSDNIRSVTPANYLDWRDEADSFELLIASNFRQAIISGDERPEQISVAEVSPEFFDVLGFSAIEGRTFAPNEGGAEDTPVAIMKETMWRNRFGADPGTVGSTVILDGEAHTVIGIVPENFDFLLGGVSFWIADNFESQRDDRTTRSLVVMGTRRPGVTLDAAQAEMTTIGGRLADRYPEDNLGVSVDVLSIRENFPGRADTMLVQLLMGVVMLVLLVACVNVANLYLAKAESRQQELSIRSALGAGRGTLFAQLMSESFVLASISAMFGLVGAYLGLQWLSQSAMSTQIPAPYLPVFDSAAVIFTLGIAAASSLAFGVSPALQSLRGHLAASLTGTSRGGTATRSRKRMRSALVAAEFAMALAVLVGAGTLYDLMHSRIDIDPGFDTTALVATELRLPPHKYTDAEARGPIYEQLELELDRLPGNPDWAFTSYMPRTDSWGSSRFSLDAAPTEDTDRPLALAMSVSHSYMNTLGIPLAAGRGFEARDTADQPLVVVVNESFVDSHFPDESAVGERITIFGESREIVGVARDIAQIRLAGLEPNPETIMFPVAQRPTIRTYLAIRADTAREELARHVQQAVWRVDADVPIGDIRSIEDHFATVLAGPRAITTIVFGIGLLTLALASIGVYGVMAFSVVQQTREIGIRVALGAQAGSVLRQVGAQGMKLAIIGLLFGVPLAYLVVMMIYGAMTSPEFSGEGSLSALPIVLVTSLLVGVGMLACYLPARRATKIDPILALSQE